MPGIEFNQIYNMDCVEGMQQIPDGSIGLVITDPPCNAQGNFIPMVRWDTSNWPPHIHHMWDYSGNRPFQVLSGKDMSK